MKYKSEVWTDDPDNKLTHRINHMSIISIICGHKIMDTQKIWFFAVWVKGKREVRYVCVYKENQKNRYLDAYFQTKHHSLQAYKVKRSSKSIIHLGKSCLKSPLISANPLDAPSWE